MTGLEDIDTQKKGFVLVCYNVDNNSFFSHVESELLQLSSKVATSLPFRFAGQHFCFTDRLLYPFLGLFQIAIGKQGRLRFRPHFGKTCVSASCVWSTSRCDAF